MAKTRDISKLVQGHRAELSILSIRVSDLRQLDQSERAWAAENLLFRAAVEWEVLSSQWLLASLNKNNKVLRSHVTKEVLAAIRKRFPTLLDSEGISVRFEHANHFNLALVASLMDPQGRNEGFWQSEHLKTNRHLIPKSLLDRITSFNENDWRTLAVVQHGRNVIAHRSDQSIRRMNEALRDCGHSNSAKLRRLVPGTRSINAGNWGNFLQAVPSGSKWSRLQIVIDSLDRVVSRLDPHS